jgi:hypothetical protein
MLRQVSVSARNRAQIHRSLSRTLDTILTELCQLLTSTDTILTELCQLLTSTDTQISSEPHSVTSLTLLGCLFPVLLANRLAMRQLLRHCCKAVILSELQTGVSLFRFPPIPVERTGNVYHTVTHTTSFMCLSLLRSSVFLTLFLTAMFRSPVLPSTSVSYSVPHIFGLFCCPSFLVSATHRHLLCHSQCHC